MARAYGLVDSNDERKDNHMERKEAIRSAYRLTGGSILVFDAANKTAVKMIAKTWLKSAKIQDVGAYFAVSDAKSELSSWDSRSQRSDSGADNEIRRNAIWNVGAVCRFLSKAADRRAGL